MSVSHFRSLCIPKITLSRLFSRWMMGKGMCMILNYNVKNPHRQRHTENMQAKLLEDDWYEVVKSDDVLPVFSTVESTYYCPFLLPFFNFFKCCATFPYLLLFFMGVQYWFDSIYKWRKKVYLLPTEINVSRCKVKIRSHARIYWFMFDERWCLKWI